MRVPVYLFIAFWLLQASLVLRAAAPDPFEFDQVFIIKIDVPQEGIAVLGESSSVRGSWRGGGGGPVHRPKTKATVTINGEIFKEVSIKLKGAAGSFQPIYAKPAFTMNLDTHIDDQNFRGYDKFYLNNSRQDDTFCNEIICRELFNRAGIPTPRATHATVELNGRDLGLYVMVEGFNKKWLRRHFDNIDGNLYDGGFLKDIFSDLSVNAGADPLNYDAKQALEDALYEKDLVKRLEKIKEHLDVEMFLTHVALDVFTWNWDGYAMKHNNYRLYHNLDTGKFQFIPHGMDQMFEDPYASIYPRIRGVVAMSLFQVPEIPNQYFERMRKLYGTVFQPERLIKRINELEAVIAPELEKRSERGFSYHQRAVSQLQDNIRIRGGYLSEELSAPDRALKFPESGELQIQDWQSHQYMQGMQFDEADKDKRQVLEVKSDGQRNLGRWHSTQLLTHGTYRFEASVRYERVVPIPTDPASGVRIRVSQYGANKPLTGSHGWTDISTEFRIHRPVEEVELSCELRCMQGIVWFDRDSLRLVKID